VLTRWSFRAKSRAEMEALVAGPAIFICNECVDLCKDVIATTVSSKKRKEKPLKRALVQVERLRRDVGDHQQMMVDIPCERGS
jgi:ATP-dependent protease Clp ATPase subunit